MATFSITPIAYIYTCFPEKFGIPRQALLAPSAQGRVVLVPPFNQRDYIAGLEQVSHIWLTFIFHQHWGRACKPKVRPPRLGGNSKLGVFASRSSFRPNYLGQSVVSLDAISEESGQWVLQVSGVDMVDGTPIVDIKPYIPYADTVPHACVPYASTPPSIIPVEFTEPAQLFCAQYAPIDDVQTLIVDILQQDPRPAYQADPQRLYTLALLDMQIRWACHTGAAAHIVVLEIGEDLPKQTQ